MWWNNNLMWPLSSNSFMNTNSYESWFPILFWNILLFYWLYRSLTNATQKQNTMIISMGWCKKDITPLLTHCSHVFLAITHRFVHAGPSCYQWLYTWSQPLRKWCYINSMGWCKKDVTPLLTHWSFLHWPMELMSSLNSPDLFQR